ncbi:MAG TPA: PQQ-dependent sugar dehydrogenase [candidate division Zixibacteria bacterium]|nr:PQQ-dependent sugar dehydrogenase [candidate division Zixibacteria bacterium]
MTPTVVQDGLVHPWDVAFTPDGHLLVTERPGRVRIYASGAAGAPLLRTITIPNVRAEGEAGLMGIAVDVGFAANRFVYVCASRSVGGAWTNQVLRYRVAADLSWTDGRVLLTGMRANVIHNGCALEMDRFGRLWITMGDANDALLAQNPSSLNGKVLRIHRDGSIPSDNPIMEGASARTAVFSMGHRNPQGIAFQPGTDRVYTAEHGPDRDDEINRIQAGGNYGWPCYTGAGVPRLAHPVCGPASEYLTPAWTSGVPTIATSGLAFADGSPWADWDGHLFVAQLKEADLRRFIMSGDGATATQVAVHFNGSWGRLRAAARGPAGQLYLTTSNGSNDRVIRVAVTTPLVDRWAGADRYGTAAVVSQRTTSPGVGVVYVATGADFADALTGGAAAAHENGPLLLVTRTAIPPATAAELERLNPARIVVLGGTAAISQGVLNDLGAYTTGTVERRDGADRYQTAAHVSRDTFPIGVPVAFIATGATFADALAGVAAAAHLGGPLLLTRRDELPSATIAELQRLRPGRIYVLGGTAAISNAVLNALDAHTTGPVSRLAGADRYGTAAEVSRLWPRANRILVATGAAFPDGIAGGTAAGRLDVPLLLVRPGVVPMETGEAMIRLHPTAVTVIGGASAVGSGAVSHLRAILAIDP